MLTFFGVCAAFHDKMENADTKKKINIGVVCVFFIFFAFRGYLYTDWTTYMDYLNRIEWKDLLSWNPIDSKSFEPGFALLALSCKSIYNSYPLLVFVCTCIDTLLFLRFLRRREIDNVAFAFMLFITFEGLSIMFNLMRNAISIFILMNALEYIESRKPLKYYALCFVALMFHMSSLVFLPLYFFLHKKFNRWVYLGLTMACLAFFLSKISLVSTAVGLLGLEGMFGGKVEAYTEYMTSSRTLGITNLLEIYGLVFLVFLYYEEITERFPNHVVILNCLGMFLVMFFVFAEFKTLSSRLATLFYFSFWILWIDVLRVLYIKNNKVLLSLLLFLYCTFLTIRNVSTPCQEYDNLLFGGKSYQERQVILNRTYEEDE